jgi:hypothetical protein
MNPRLGARERMAPSEPIDPQTRPIRGPVSGVVKLETGNDGIIMDHSIRPYDWSQHRG